MREDLSREEIVGVVERAVEELLGRAGVGGPPVDALALAERHLGMVVSVADGPSRRGKGRSAEGRSRLVLPADQSVERHQWTAAHAIGEHLRPDLLRGLGLEPQQARVLVGGSLPTLVAHRLLVPTCWWRDDAPALGHDVARLKERYRTAGNEVVALRLLDLPDPCVIAIVDNGHVHRRRSNAWRVSKRLEPAEQECQRYVNEYSRSHVVCRNGWTVQGWPFHRPDGKRAILRSVVDADAGWPVDESPGAGYDD